MCKHSDMFSLAVLIGRGLEPLAWFRVLQLFFLITPCLFSFQGMMPERLPSEGVFLFALFGLTVDFR